MTMPKRAQTKKARLLLPGDVVFDAPTKFKVLEVQNKREGMTRVQIKEHGKPERWTTYQWDDRVRLY
ncbi:hypothetical protein SEA_CHISANAKITSUNE_92 [Gordonia phage ChisanaKitsune]|uniref:Uncharacterized protein n=1 Tax=Gordonia phage ChisanaKitsune TaxID=2871538 RepID=A0AAE8C1A3_9CAUD|nr:hypothetical protein PQD15_gp092 [Gordonia phage ChisanaKitsune]QZE10857.1 hypothetical protein SEA_CHISANAKITSUNE_92 [Gordonia phage ChisanaKitsune]